MLTATLRPYQDEAVDQVLDLGYGLIAFEMGLGKTLVAIACVEELIGEGEIDMAMLIVPSGLKHQWARSIAKFTDVDSHEISVKKQSITVPTEDFCIVVDGDPAARKKQYKKAREQRPDYVILSYEQLVNDWATVRTLDADCVVIDEAGAIKSFKAQRSKAVKRLNNKPYRFALTGTPIENRPEEAYSIMDFVCPGYLGRFDLFDKTYIRRDRYGGVEGYKNLDLLHKKMRKVMPRKTSRDPDVSPYLPDVSHTRRYVGLNPRALALYDHIAHELLDELRNLPHGTKFDIAAYYTGRDTHEDMSAQGRAMAKIMCLQMLCDHPELLRVSAQRYLEGKGEGSEYAHDLLAQGMLDNLGKSDKLSTITGHVTDLLEFNQQNKIIIFSFFRDMQEYLAHEFSGYGLVRYNGQMSLTEKSAALARFQEDPKTRLFLSSDAGGYGVDLPQANHLINVDLSWSAGKMDQRNARHVRVGSEWDRVFISDYIVGGSIEERIASILDVKRKVARAAIDGKGADAGSLDVSLGTLCEWLEG